MYCFVFNKRSGKKLPIHIIVHKFIHDTLERKKNVDISYNYIYLHLIIYLDFFPREYKLTAINCRCVGTKYQAG